MRSSRGDNKSNKHLKNYLKNHKTVYLLKKYNFFNSIKIIVFFSFQSKNGQTHQEKVKQGFFITKITNTFDFSNNKKNVVFLTDFWHGITQQKDKQINSTFWGQRALFHQNFQKSVRKKCYVYLRGE